MATIRVPDVFSPVRDCEKLNEAIRGLGTDERSIIWILGRRSASQREKIRETYWNLHHENLIDVLKSELSNDFGNAMILWASDPAERDARLANEALKKKKKGMKQLQVIVEIACSPSPHHLVAVRQAYCSLFHTSLEEDIALAVSSSLRKVLVALVSSYRYDKDTVDLEVADVEARVLHETIKAKQFEQDGFLLILGTRNAYQLRATFQSYQQKYGKPVYKDIESCGNGDMESLLKVVIWCFDCPEKHFAGVIRDSVAGFGTDEDSLTRAIVSRAEIDMMKIKEEYLKTYKETVDQAVTGDTSGDYKHFLLTLLGSIL